MKFSIQAKKREGVKVDEIRTQGQIPAVIYGPQIKPISVAVNYREFEKLYKEAGEASLIDCVVEGEKEPVIALIQDTQHDPIRGRIIHVDFRQIRMDQVMHATVELRFIGEPPAVKELGGTFISPIDSVEVECLPKDLVGHIDVDVSSLNNFDKIIHIKDLVLPVGITITDDLETVVAKVTASLTEEQIKAMEEEGQKGVEAVEVVEKKKEDGEAAEAGAEEKTAGEPKAGDKKAGDKADKKSDKK